jgi:hypothetical protein
MTKTFLLRAGTALLLGVTLSTSLAGCATAIPTKPINNVSNQTEEKNAFNDKLASSELSKIKHLVEDELDKGFTHQEAGNELKKVYTPVKGVEWNYAVTEDGKGYILKVWTPSGGSFTTEEDSMELESYDEIPADSTSH